MTDLRQAAQRLVDRIDRDGASPLDWSEYNALRTALEQQDKLMQEPIRQEFFPMDSAPTDGTIVRLLVNFEDHSLEDENKPVWTIGACSFSHNEDPTWQLAGWNWSYDCFTKGRGKPIGWLPMLDTTPPQQQAEPVLLECVTCGTVYADGVPPQVPVQEQAEPTPWRDMVVVSLVREGIDKHKARELADHFAAPPQREPLTEAEAMDLLPTNHNHMTRTESLMWVLRATERAHNIKEQL